MVNVSHMWYWESNLDILHLLQSIELSLWLGGSYKEYLAIIENFSTHLSNEWMKMYLPN